MTDYADTIKIRADAGADAAGNIRISVRDVTDTSGLIASNITGNNADSPITATRIQ